MNDGDSDDDSNDDNGCCGGFLRRKKRKAPSTVAQVVFFKNTSNDVEPIDFTEHVVNDVVTDDDDDSTPRCLICWHDLKIYNVDGTNDGIGIGSGDAYNAVTSLECAHVFHTTCIGAWLQQGKRWCPMCRHPVMVPSPARMRPAPALATMRNRPLMKFNEPASTRYSVHWAI